MPLLQRLMGDKNWRVRHSIVLLLPKLAKELGETEFASAFSSTFEGHTTDQIALIRQDVIRSLGEVGAIFGQEWLESNVRHLLVERAEDKSYQIRSVLLHGLDALSGALTANTLEVLLIPKALEMAEDKVANLRIDAVRSLAKSARHVNPQLYREKILPMLQKRSEDDDMDVKHFALEGLKDLESLGN